MSMRFESLRTILRSMGSISTMSSSHSLIAHRHGQRRGRTGLRSSQNCLRCCMTTAAHCRSAFQPCTTKASPETRAIGSTTTVRSPNTSMGFASWPTTTRWQNPAQSLHSTGFNRSSVACCSRCHPSFTIVSFLEFRHMAITGRPSSLVTVQQVLQVAPASTRAPSTISLLFAISNLSPMPWPVNGLPPTNSKLMMAS